MAKKINDLTLAASAVGIMQVETDIGGATANRITLDVTGTYIAETKTYTALTTTSKAIIGAINEVKSDIVAESIWDRDPSGTNFIKPQNAGDNLNMLQGDIYTVDPANTSGTKSYEISQVLTGSVPASEHASMIFKGLSAGGQRTFMTYFGASNSTTFAGEDWIFDNTIGTIALLHYKVNLNAEGGSGIFFDKVFGRNSASAEVAYYQDRAIIGVNTAGSEDGIHVMDVTENGVVQTEYFRLDGLLREVKSSKKFVTTDKLTIRNTANPTIDLASLEAVITDVVPGFETSTVTLYAIATASPRAFMSHEGVNDYTDFTASEYRFNNGSLSNAVMKKTISASNAATEFVNTHQYIGLDDAGTPNQVIYSQVDTKIGAETSGAESGQYLISVMEAGSSELYLELNGLTKHSNFRSLQYNFYSSAVLDSVQIVAASQQDSAFGLVLTLKADGLSDTQQAVTYSDTRINIVSAVNGAETSTHTISVMEAGSLEQYINFSGGVQRVDIARDLLVTGDITSNVSATDGYVNSLDASAVEQVRWDTNGDSWIDGNGFIGFGNKLPLAKVDITGDQRVLIPSAIFAYNTALYTTGTGLTTPAAVAAPLTKNLDANSVWTIDSPAAGEMSYSGITKYFGIQCNITVATNSGGNSTITLKIQKQIGSGGWVDVPQGIVKRFLSGTNDTGSFCLGCSVSMASGDDLRLEITSSAGGPKYDFEHIGFQVTALT